MNKFANSLAAAAVAISFAASANAAGYIKFDGVDGEATSAEWRGGNTLVITTGEEAVLVGLLLPAVQAAREAASRPAPGRARKVAAFEIEDGGKSWTLHDATIRPTGDPHTVEIDYRCKDWIDARSGKSGSDCPGAARAGYGKDGAKGGNVEYEWKVEEGES